MALKKRPTKKPPCTFDQEILAKIDAILKGNCERPPQVYKAILEVFPGREPEYEKFLEAYREGITPQDFLEALFSPVAIKEHRPPKAEKRHRAGQPEKRTLAPGIEWIPVGKGITQGSRVSVQLDIATADHAKRVLRIMMEEAMAETQKSFDQKIARHEREAIMILELAKLPTNFGDSSTPPKEWDVSPTNTLDGRTKKVLFALSRMYPELGGMGLTEFVTSRGYRELEDPEWYAAAIVEAISITRAAIRRQDMDFALSQAYEIGRLVTETKAKGFFVKLGATGRKREGRILPIKELIRSLDRKNKQGTAADLWAMIPTDQIGGIKISGYRFYRNAGRLIALGKVDGYRDPRPVGRPLKKRSFEKRVTQVRKPRTR